VFSELASANYRGWFVVEAEQDPTKAPALRYARLARDYLRTQIGL
jgi:inosose dehydratase